MIGGSGEQQGQVPIPPIANRPDTARAAAGPF
jgi:hypothetical protein